MANFTEEELKEMGMREVKYNFRIVHKVNIKFIEEMLYYKNKVDEAKTKPKKDLYNKKFKKVQKEFIDNTARLDALQRILQENNIDPESVLKEENEKWK